MSATTFIVPKGGVVFILPYVGAALLSSAFLVTAQIVIVGRRRAAAGIHAPQLYAENAQVEKSVHALRLNCAQRAHLNTLEYIPFLYLTTCITACKYPILAASLCGSWVFARIFYTRGYVSEKPSKRFWGAETSVAALIGLVLSATYTVGEAVMAELSS
ncbi:hypothetical protein BDP27DRAFT_1404206 [Rhodocollybia butyracea]|uniref:Glutathione transferase n=1 Tax=Rhodocollybia butyracea TaxID=206335 RepID=A0A9P5U4G7_9AGAR|nr:hypothetical protein BDP27DRAFT_1404206 [Rhodocollybia butyracea]